MAERMIEANGVELCVESFGDPDDPAILLIMGATASMLRWPLDVCEGLAAGGRHVIRYDNRDVGRSTSYPPGEAPYTLVDLAADAVGVLDAHGIDRAHFVGASMGGMISQLAALDHRDRVRTISLLYSTPAGPDLGAAIMGGETDLPGPTPKMIEAIITAAGPVDAGDPDALVEQAMITWRALAGTKYAFDEEEVRGITAQAVARARNWPSRQNHALAVGTTPSWRDRLGSLDVPTLVIHGTEDPMAPIEHGRALAAEIPGARLIELEGVGHEQPAPVRPDVVAAILEHTSTG